MREVIHAVNLDDGESVFFARELEYVKTRSYDRQYPEFKAQKVIPVSTEAGTEAETITYQSYDVVGLMKIISNYADDLPRADVRGEEFSTPVRSIGGSYGYNVQEIRTSRKIGRPLDQRRALAARQAYEQTVNRIAWFAKADDGLWGKLVGLIYNANITKADSSTANWLTATADQIIAAFATAFYNMVDLTKGVEWPDTALVPPAQFGRMRTLPRATVSDTTVFEFIMKAHPELKKIEWVNELKAVSPKPSTPTVVGSSEDIMILYKYDPMKLTLEIPQPFEQFPVQERGLEYTIPTHARCGGVIVYYPLSLAIIEKLGVSA
jgi:hypothetical protein